MCRRVTCCSSISSKDHHHHPPPPQKLAICSQTMEPPENGHTFFPQHRPKVSGPVPQAGPGTRTAPKNSGAEEICWESRTKEIDWKAFQASIVVGTRRTHLRLRRPVPHAPGAALPGPARVVARPRRPEAEKARPSLLEEHGSRCRDIG